MRYAQIVMGPAGGGKSTYCSALAQHASDLKRKVHIINLDPAAEYFDYEPLIDIRELVQLDDVLEDEDLNLGPNGSAIYCMEYILENMEWLEDKLGELSEDYVVFDCMGQIELYVHLNLIQKFIKTLENWNFKVCCLYFLDVQFMIDGAKFLSGTMSALTTMINLEAPHVNVLSKMDLLNKRDRGMLEEFLTPDTQYLIDDIKKNHPHFHKKYLGLTEALGDLIESFPFVRFRPLNVKDSESIGEILMEVDNALQYGEDEDIQTQDFE